MTKREVFGWICGLAALGAVLMAWPTGAATGDLGPSSATQVNPQGEGRADVSANSGYLHSEWCPGVAVTTMTDAQEMDGRKSIAIQNLSSATCYATFDAQSPVTSGALGWKLAAGDSASFDFGDAATLKVACTAATTTGACLQILQAK